jgi:hypothetical protein
MFYEGPVYSFSATFFSRIYGLYCKTIMIVTLVIVSDATIWSITYDHN